MESSITLILPLLVAAIAAVVYMVSNNGKVALVFAREFVKLF